MKVPEKPKVKVTTNAYAYMGLFADAIVEVDEVYMQDSEVTEVGFTLNGKYWLLNRNQFEIVPLTPVTPPKVKKGSSPEKGPIKSDGGSSSYYDMELPESLLNSLIERQKQGKTFVKTEELISVLFDNDYDFGCAFKALVRAKQNLEGVGKAGNDLRYETTKLRYYAEKIFEQGEKN